METKKGLKETKGNSVFKNTVFNFACQFVNLVAPLFTGVYIARVFNADLIGQNSYVASIVSYFSLVIIFGTNLYGAIAISKARENLEEKSKIFWELVIIKTGTFAFSLLVYSLLIAFYSEYRILLLIYLISMFTSYVDITWYFQGIERFDFISWETVITKVLAVTFVFIFIKTKEDFYLYVAISLLSALIPILLLYPFLIKGLAKVKLSSLSCKRHLAKLFPFFLTSALISIYAVLDKTMLKVITNSTEEVGYYEQAHKIYNLCSTLTVVMGPVINARIAFSYNDEEKRNNLFDIGFRYAFMMSFPIMVGCLLISGEIIEVFFGEGYDPSKTVLMIFSGLPLITSVSMMCGHMYYTPQYKTKYSVLACGIGAVINFGLNILFAYFYGAVGAAVATVIAEFIITAIEIALFKDLNKKHFFLSSLKYIIASAVMGGILFLLIKFVTLDNEIVDLAVKILVSACVYFLLLVLMKEKLVWLVINGAYNKLKRLNRTKR